MVVSVLILSTLPVWMHSTGLLTMHGAFSISGAVRQKRYPSEQQARLVVQPLLEQGMHATQAGCLHPAQSGRQTAFQSNRLTIFLEQKGVADGRKNYPQRQSRR